MRVIGSIEKYIRFRSETVNESKLKSNTVATFGSNAKTKNKRLQGEKNDKNNAMSEVFAFSWLADSARARSICRQEENLCD